MIFEHTRGQGAHAEEAALGGALLKDLRVVSHSLVQVLRPLLPSLRPASDAHASPI